MNENHKREKSQKQERAGVVVGRWLCFCSQTQIPKFSFVQNNKFQSIICGIVHSLKQQTPESPHTPHPPLALSPCSRKCRQQLICFPLFRNSRLFMISKKNPHSNGMVLKYHYQSYFVSFSV